MALQGRKILLGVCGSIAAYKVCPVGAAAGKGRGRGAGHSDCLGLGLCHAPHARYALQKAGSDGLFEERSRRRVAQPRGAGPVGRCLADCAGQRQHLAQLANGHCPNSAGAVYLSARCPVFLAPAMDLDMYAHPAVTENLARLRSLRQPRVRFARPASWPAAFPGPGRMLEPEDIVLKLDEFFSR